MLYSVQSDDFLVWPEREESVEDSGDESIGRQAVPVSSFSDDQIINNFKSFRFVKNF